MDIKTLFDEALLAQAAYALFSKKDMKDDELINALLSDEDNDVTQAQAEYFASKYIVVQQSEVPEPDTGFSATLFQNIESGKYQLANRGSDGIFNVDFTSANTQNFSWGMSYDQVADLINFYHRLTTASTMTAPQFTFEIQSLEPGTIPPAGSVFRYHEFEDDTQEPTVDVYLVFKQKVTGAIGFGQISNTEGLNVSGHSLGGHLASAFSLLFPSVINQTSTFDSAGIIGKQFDELASAIAEVLGIVPHKVAEPNVNIIDIKSPLDPVSSLGSHLGGGLVDVFIEAEDSFPNKESHGMDRLVDSLAVMNLLYTLDNSFTLAKGNKLLPLASSDEYTELEGIMNYLARLFNQDEVAITESDHDVVYSTIKKITDSLGGKTYQISEITSTITAQAAAGDKAALYALINLQPFVVRGTSQATNDALYQSHSANDALDVKNFSEQYLTDRAAMLQWLIKHNEENESYGDRYDANGFNYNITYTDLDSEITNGQDLVLKIDGTGPSLDYKQIKFGTEGNDSGVRSIVGGANDDRLYGGAGNDDLYGKKGEDYIDGGIGNDTLYGGDGADTLYGGKGEDRLEAGAEDVYGEGKVNILQGGADNDTLVGGDGIDILYGGTGNDTLFVDRGGFHVTSPLVGGFLGWEYMNGGEGFDTYYIGGASNYNIIADSDGLGEIYVKASNIGDNTYKLTGGNFWGEQTITDRSEGDIEADGYTQIHADGSTSNFTVAYELDNSQTLIGYGFNIYNFYNGMLGINLVGGRVSSDPVTVDDVLKKLVFDEAFKPEEIEQIKNAIKDAYEQSPAARKMLRDFAVVGGNDINIFFSEGGFSSSSGPREGSTDTSTTGHTPGIYIDLNWLENNTYISTNGTAVEDTLETALIHEIVHLMKGSEDTTNPGEKGATVVLANTIYAEMGLAEQVSYLAYDSTGQTHVTGFEYTQGQAIDRAFTLLTENSPWDGFDSTIGGDLDDLIIGNERNNTLITGEGDDFLYGGAGSDYLEGGIGNDFLYGGEGHDFLDGGEGHDFLSGGMGDETLVGGNGDDTLSGGMGNDRLWGGNGNDTYIYSLGDGNTEIINEDSDGGIDTLQFMEGITPSDVSVKRSLRELRFTIGTTGDTVTLFTGDDGENRSLNMITFSNGSAWDWTSLKKMVIQSTEGNDDIFGYYEDDVFDGGLGNDVIKGYGGNDTLLGGGGVDALYGNDGNDYLIGGEGGDTLRGGGGDDILHGGKGGTGFFDDTSTVGTDDTLIGGAGNDTYLFELGDGNTSINNWDTEGGTDSGTDTLQFMAGIDVSDISVKRNTWGSLLLTVMSTGEVITIHAAFNNEDYLLDRVTFSDASVWNWAELKEMVLQVTEGNDFIVGYDEDDVFDGGLGGDEIRGEGGNDTLLGGEGDDHLYGGIGNDVLNGGIGNDVLNGGLGDDNLTGGDGNDTYLYSLGDGKSSIYNYDSDGGVDTLQFMEGIVPSDVNVDRFNSNLRLTIGTTGDSITIYYPFDGEDYLLNMVTFSDGTTWDWATLKTMVLQITEGDDDIFGYESDDVIDGGLGDDRIYGYGGDDTLLGGAGDDQLFGHGGNDYLNGGSGKDIVSGGAGDDILRGGTGDGDNLFGGEGDNTFLFALGDGNTTIQTDGWVDNVNTLQFMTGIAADDVQVTRDERELNFTIALTGEVITMQAPLTSANDVSRGFVNDLFRFDNGTIWDWGTLKALMLQGGDGDDILEGFSSDDVIHGGAGNDTLNGGLGNDELDGGKGDDSYVFNLGDGQDIFSDSNGTDKIVFGAGITAANLRITHDITETHWIVELLYNNGEFTGDKITVANAYGNNEYLFESFEFSDGTSMLLAEIQLAAETLYTELEPEVIIEGTIGDDELVGDESANIINGYDGNDTLIGRLDNDTLNGGLGNDTLKGGQGDDLYLYNLGDGNDTIKDKSGSDTLRFGAGITADNINISANDTDMLITLPDGQVITLANWEKEGSSRLEQFEFADGTVWAVTDILSNMVIVGNEGDGNVHNKFLVSGTTYDMGLGDDTVFGGQGDDAYLYNLGDGNDTIKDKSGLDTLRFGSGITAENISVSTNDSDMLITLSDGKVITIANWYQLYSSRIEQLEFEDGTVWAAADILANMVVAGTDGDDNINNKKFMSGTTYDTGLGNDIVFGGQGDDSYLYNLGDGNDTIKDKSGSDTLRFGAGISTDNISVSANDSDMLITLSDGQVITIVNWYQFDISRIEQFEFGDGTVWVAADILANMVVAGTDGDDNINNKKLMSGTTYETGLGNDIVFGGQGDDAYLYNLGDGNDTIKDKNGSDTLRFGSGITADNISVSTNDSDMLITLSDEQVITIANWYQLDSSRIEQFEFEDGTVWAKSDIIGNISVEANISTVVNQAKSTNSVSSQSEPLSDVSSIDSNLNLLIQSYSSFDDASDESGLELEKDKYSIVLPVLENIM